MVIRIWIFHINQTTWNVCSNHDKAVQLLPNEFPLFGRAMGQDCVDERIPRMFSLADYRCRDLQRDSWPNRDRHPTMVGIHLRILNQYKFIFLKVFWLIDEPYREILKAVLPRSRSLGFFCIHGVERPKCWWQFLPKIAVDCTMVVSHIDTEWKVIFISYRKWVFAFWTGSWVTL